MNTVTNCFNQLVYNPQWEGSSGIAKPLTTRPGLDCCSCPASLAASDLRLSHFPAKVYHLDACDVNTLRVH